MKTTNTERSNHPVNLWLELFGDRWTLLIMRDMLMDDKSTFKEFMNSPEKISTNILTNRLKFLVDQNMVTRENASSNKLVKIYKPTDQTKTLLPLLNQIDHWASKHLKPISASTKEESSFK
jgi:DNA-binding HxlR family transcriptional regulator